MKKFTSPLAVYLPRKTKADKKCILNLNYYRNWTHFMSNDIKSQYCEAMRGQLEGLVLDWPISVSYRLYRNSKRKGDRQNVLSIHEKFFMDALVKFGCIPDDTDDYLIESGPYTTGPIDRVFPRVEIIVKEMAGA